MIEFETGSATLSCATGPTTEVNGSESRENKKKQAAKGSTNSGCGNEGVRGYDRALLRSVILNLDLQQISYTA